MAISIEQVETLHRAAQAKLGLYAALLGRYGFPTYSGKNPPKLDSWLNLLVDQVFELRELSAQLAITYYQLARWMETGRSLGVPLDEGSRTGNDLLSSFLARAQAVDDVPLSDTELGADLKQALGGSSEHPLNSITLADYLDAMDGLTGGEGRVAVDAFRWPVLNRAERARKTIITALTNSAGINTRYTQAKEAGDPDAVADKLSEAVDGAAKSGASKADTLVMSAGRGVVDYAYNGDNRLLMYARGTSSNPCAFCAMLASRGFVYWSASSAGSAYRDGAMRSYHDNCHCFPIARWVETSELPALNKYFQAEWPKVTASYKGSAAKLNAWRRWLNNKRRESRVGSRK